MIQQLSIAEWHVDKGQIVQALSIAREWLPALLCYRFKVDALSVDKRRPMSDLLEGASTVAIGKQQFAWDEVSQPERLRDVWNRLAGLRNDVLHAGLSHRPRPATEVIAQARQILAELHEIAASWNLR